VKKKKEFLTLDDVKLKGKTVICRLDLNSPIDEETKRFINPRRLDAALETLTELKKKGARTVVLAHQGRPGTYDFTTLEQHAEYFNKKLKIQVQYVDEVVSSNVIKTIKKMKDGEIIMLENVRFLSEELLDRPYDVLARTYMVRTLASVADYFVSDCFAVTHRNQTSIVGFPVVLLTVAGRIIEREIRVLEGVVKEGTRPILFVLGGAKIGTSIKVAGRALELGAEKVLTCGALGMLFLQAKGYDLGRENTQFLKGARGDEYLPTAKKLLKKYNGQIETPIDVALDNNGVREEFLISELPRPRLISDIGEETVTRYSKEIKGAKTIIINGPCGVYERQPFSYGTKEIFTTAANSNAFTIAGGGHTSSAISQLGLEKKFNHVSTGGNACMLFLADEELPGIRILKESYQWYLAGKYKNGHKQLKI
jgi:phosphoglycerate kinase